MQWTARHPRDSGRHVIWGQVNTVHRCGRREGRLRTAGRKKGIIMENKTIQVTVQGGVVVDVKNLPEGWDLQIIDKDNE